MSDYIRDSITGFHDSIQKSYQVLESNKLQIEDRRGKLLDLMKTGVSIPKAPAGNGEYHKICQDMLQNVQEQIEQWTEYIQKQIERSEFVNQYEKSILAIVFADVNAGKSSLGNFISGYTLQGTSYADLYSEPTYFKHSVENQSREKIENFQEGVTETTSEIQLFTLKQGLTWVDTPGLHSLTTEYGDLTKEYIQFADLVVFLTSSSSPLKSDERELLSELLHQDKAVILAITKSDEQESIYVNGRLSQELIAKSSENRTAQEEFIKDEIKSLCSDTVQLENSHALSLSTMLANQAVKEQDEQGYRDSNLDGFLVQIGEILSEKAIELKMRRPKAEVNAFISQLVGSDEASSETGFQTISLLRRELREKSSMLEKLLTGKKAEEETIWSTVQQQLPLSLSVRFRKLREQRKLDDAKTVSREMAEVAATLAAEICTKHFKELWKISQLNVSFGKLKLDDAAGKGYTVNHTTQVLFKEVERAPKGLFEHIERFFDKDRKFFSYVNENVQVAIGDNFAEFLMEQEKSISPEVKKYISSAVDQMVDACITPLMNCYQELDRQLEALTASLEAVRFQEK